MLKESSVLSKSCFSSKPPGCVTTTLAASTCSARANRIKKNIVCVSQGRKFSRQRVHAGPGEEGRV
eukprot:450886-Hanusia_phi.AAC.1